MTALEALNALRARFPECELVALADLSADLVLATSADTKMPQERWDGLSELARDLLQGDGARTLLDCFEHCGAHQLSRAALVDAHECDIFLTATEAPEYVLCAVGSADISVGAFNAAAQPVLDGLVQSD